jgi:hypothetical protein
MASYIGTYPDTLTAPATGTVNAIRVKVGATTGPMRVDVIRFLFQQNPGDPSHPTSAGPFLEAYGPQFTPNANAVTQVATKLAMREDPTPALTDGTTIQVIDSLSLEVEAPNVPVPAFADPAPGVLSYVTYPSPTDQNLAAPSFNRIPGTLLSVGAGVLMSADLTTSAPPVTTPTVNLPGRAFKVRRGATTIPVQCRGADCAGLLALQSGAGAARADGKSTKRMSVYGTARFTARAGRTASVAVKLNAAGRALLKHHTQATVYARVTFSSGGGAPKSFRVTLKR